ncbi:exonuclease III [Thiohalobacter thiocyanaticus]|uniref:Exonuclease III n=1 Tax=Thiohalobacter thiocyanaticus TaxID=585455 RepID=A0A1Z4VQH1_9GAMM|nr:DUF4268 domain-containing protein [Thiohalobacter thiocyanaticus]BAZ93733.1 exonuclease III [Thiohalobacter thiocyanaticus]
MNQYQYAVPVHVSDGGGVVPLKRVPLTSSEKENEYNEVWLQNVLFQEPGCLPVNEVDSAYSDLVPICRELSTSVGYIDILYATPRGQLVILEAKLWRNPESRRKVVGQILDYATELSRWSYEDLQREVSKATKRKGNVLYDIVAERFPELDESQFVDEVSQSLRLGRFLLLVAGDGIREGVSNIAEYLQGYHALHFTFGLVEVMVYQMNGGYLIQPHVLAKTEVFKRLIVEVPADNLTVMDESQEEKNARELNDWQNFYLGFWKELLSTLKLDDAGQPIPKANAVGNIYFSMPLQGGQSWITCYFLKSKNEAGVFLTFTRGELADRVYRLLEAEQEEIDRALGIEVEWQSYEGKHRILSSVRVSDIFDENNREDLLAFFRDRINRFVNTFRPRLKKIDSNQ